jgi:hypothetical protein
MLPIPRLPKSFLAALSLTAIVLVSAGLALVDPGSAPAHHLCGNTGSPAGAFDLQTYEDGNYRTTYPRTFDLAAFNQLFPDRAGFNLPPLEVGPRSSGSGQLWSPQIPPVLLKSIAWLESSWAQADYSVPYGSYGPVLASHDCGYGLMQVTSGMQNVTGVPNLDQAMIGGHYAFNIARGARILAEKWNGAPEFRPIVGDRNIHVLENWYYALWSYNGFSFKNHPLNPDYAWPRPMYDCSGPRNRPYQELVIGCANNPPSRSGTRLWNPQEVRLPDFNDPAFSGPLRLENWDPCSQSRNCAPMDIPTPNPWHNDPTTPSVPREQVIGVPNIALSTRNMSFVASPGGQSASQTLLIGNSGTGVLPFKLTTSAPWIRPSRIQGIALGTDLGHVDHTMMVQVDASSLLPGTHTGHITVESLWAIGAGTTIEVTVQTSDGGLMRPPDGRIYLLQGGLKRYVPDQATFEANGYSASRVVSVPADWAAGISTGHTLPSVLANGRLIRPPGQNVPIYVMEGGTKRHIASSGIFAHCGYGEDAVDAVSTATANSIPNGPALTAPPCTRPSFANGTLLRNSDGSMWVVQSNARKWVATGQAMANCGYHWGNANDLGDSLTAQLPRASDLHSCTAEGSLIWTENGQISVVLAGILRPIPDPITFELAGFSWANVTPVGQFGLPRGEPLLNLGITGVLIRPPGDQVPVYVLDGGVKRHITSSAAFTGCGYAWAAISTVSSAIINGIPNGPALQGAPCPVFQVPLGTLLQGDGAVWVTFGQGRKWVSNFNVFVDCGYQAGKIGVASGTVLAGLYVAPQVTGCTSPNTPVVVPDGRVYVVVSGWRRYVPSQATADALGISWGNLVPIPHGWLPTAKPLLDIAATGRLVRPPGDNVPVYVMDGASKRHITSGGVLAACGYGWDALTVLPAATLARFPDGPPLNGAPCPQPTFANGTLLLGSDGKVLVVHNGQRRWIVNAETFIACGYRGLDIDRIADSILAALPQGANLTGAPCP